MIDKSQVKQRFANSHNRSTGSLPKPAAAGHDAPHVETLNEDIVPKKDTLSGSASQFASEDPEADDTPFNPEQDLSKKRSRYQTMEEGNQYLSSQITFNP